MIIALSIALTVAAIAIVVLVLSQNGKSHGLSGTIAGGAETFFGKDKGNKVDKLLNTITTVLSIAFCVVLIVLYIIQPDAKNIMTPGSVAGNSQYNIGEDTETDAADSETSTAPETDAESSTETDAVSDAESDAESGEAESNPEGEETAADENAPVL